MVERLRAARGEEGFSLIELLIVIVILGVLAGIVVFGVGKFKGDSEFAACEADNKTYAVAQSAYKAKHGVAAANGAALKAAGYLETAVDPKTCTAP